MGIVPTEDEYNKAKYIVEVYELAKKNGVCHQCGNIIRHTSLFVDIVSVPLCSQDCLTEYDEMNEFIDGCYS